jgi:hypothetical protein
MKVTHPTRSPARPVLKLEVFISLGFDIPAGNGMNQLPSSDQSNSHPSEPLPPVRDSRTIRKISVIIVAMAISLILILAVLLSPSFSPLSTVHDLDMDGHPDASDLFPNDATEWEDTDGDGHGDNSDAFPNNATEWKDSDGDGYGNNSDAFPNNATEWIDTDGDGYGDNSDTFPNNATEWIDTDGDGYGDNSDAFPTDATEWEDTDGDGHGDNSDAFPTDATQWDDSDGDGYNDAVDAFPYDPKEWVDTDGDGHGDNSDRFPTNAVEWIDSDGDGHGDNSDPFPLDATEWIDSDGDGHGDNSDILPLDPSRWRAPFNLTFAWTYGGVGWCMTVNISGESYDNYRDIPRTYDYSVYATYGDPVIVEIATYLKSMALSRGYDSLQTANFVLTFVQSLPYTSDLNTTGVPEYARYPIETLADDGGDCEDTAILFAAIIEASPLDYDAVLVDLPGHMATGLAAQNASGWSGWYYIFEGKKYYYCETTGLGWEIGEMPVEYQGIGADIYPV